ncbi:TRAP transporter small permease [Roseibium aggregatum]|uniref:TRAP transporter small permease protein n=1 Tax=Roseibium aggregatum TaxID=187304 RepID=A0A939EFI4_9HYPH|nr:TRAP transporter small permease [Roseibium aggregatum]MBN9671542.1 TRAP transporter small permease [Roseibium aggregatum]
MAQFERLLIAVNRLLVAGALAAMFVIVFANVIGRYVFGVSLSWGEEVARFLMIFGVFAGAGLALRSGRLVEIDIVTAFLPDRLRRIVRWGAVALMAGFMALIFYYGVRFVAFGWNKETMATGISRGIPYLAVPLGAALFLCHLALVCRAFVADEFEADAVLDEQDTPL